MKIKILYKDKDILVIEKPSGISVHHAPAPRKFSPLRPQAGPSGTKISEEPALTDWFAKNYPKSKNVGEPLGDIPRPGIVHRLDKETSGVLLLAKTQKGHEFLKKQFVDREVKKTYVAIVSGDMKNDHGIINKPIGRSPSDFRRRLAGRGARGEMREAITEYKVLKRFEENENKFSLLEIYPKTGRTHQIRVHMKFLNHPVACDKLYAPKEPCPKDLNRLALHAKSIEFKNLKGEVIKVESPLPKEFKQIIA